MTRLSFAALVLAIQLAAFQDPPVVQEPPEEDVSPSEQKEYSFNPLQAQKEIKVGSFYFKKGSFRAAAKRFEEALKWDPKSSEAYLKLGEAQTKLGNAKAAKEAYAKFLELEPDSKEASDIRKKIGATR